MVNIWIHHLAFLRLHQNISQNGSSLQDLKKILNMQSLVLAQVNSYKTYLINIARPRQVYSCMKNLLCRWKYLCADSRTWLDWYFCDLHLKLPLNTISLVINKTLSNTTRVQECFETLLKKKSWLQSILPLLRNIFMTYWPMLLLNALESFNIIKKLISFFL